jgi:SAM-dependent methyltransferase
LIAWTGNPPTAIRYSQRPADDEREPTMIRRPIDWDAYLSEFHASFPGITEDVLAASVAGQLTPYQWLTHDIAPDASVLDLGCGSGPARPSGIDRWLGLDLSAGELRRAAELGRASLVRGDITRLPVASGSVDLVTSSMAMMLVHPLERALGEITRVLTGNGELRLLLPTPAPLTTADRVAYLRLFWAARSTTKFPTTPLRSAATATLESLGFDVISDERVRFHHPIRTEQDADRFVDSWYLPATAGHRRGAARGRARAMAPFGIGIPLRRVIARPRAERIGQPPSQPMPSRSPSRP